jgi:hypothetical protein
VGWCLEVRCVQPLLNGSPRFYYHDKLDAGLMADSEGRYHVTPARRPSLTEAFDQAGWSAVDVDLYESLTGRAGDGWL